MSIGAKDVSVAEIFKDLSQQTGIPIENMLKTEERITIQFTDLPMAEAVARLANVLIFYDKILPIHISSDRQVVVSAKGKGVSATGLKPALPTVRLENLRRLRPQSLRVCLGPVQAFRSAREKTRKKN